MSGVQHYILVKWLCIPCLVTSKQFVWVELNKQHEMTDTVKAGAEYCAIFEKIVETREKQHASASTKRFLELLNGSQGGS